MNTLKRWLFVIVCVLSPLIISGIFMAVGHPDKNGRYSVTGETTSTPKGYKELICESQRKIADSAAHALGTEVPQDSGSGCVATNTEAAQMGSAVYYGVDVSSPSAFYNAVNGAGFNEGYGLQCVAGFKEFMFALSGKYVASAGGGANSYASQQGQIEPLGFKWHTGSGGLQDGDWGIFGGGTYGHVAMYYQGEWLGQNQGAANANAGNAFSLKNLGSFANTLIGYYRPNIYQKTSSPAPSNTSSSSSSTSSTQGSASNTPASSYIVRRGDTLGSISLKNGWWLSLNGLYGDSGYTQRLADLNGIKNRGVIYPSQVLVPAK